MLAAQNLTLSPSIAYCIESTVTVWSGDKSWFAVAWVLSKVCFIPFLRKIVESGYSLWKNWSLKLFEAAWLCCVRVCLWHPPVGSVILGWFSYCFGIWLGQGEHRTKTSIYITCIETWSLWERWSERGRRGMRHAELHSITFSWARGYIRQTCIG